MELCLPYLFFLREDLHLPIRLLPFVGNAVRHLGAWRRSSNGRDHVCSGGVHMCSNIEHMCSNIEHMCSNIKHMCSNVVHMCSNIVRMCSSYMRV